MSFKKFKGLVLLLIIFVLIRVAAYSLEPPTREQIQRYKQDGTYPARVAAAKAIGNHLMDREVMTYLNYKVKRLALEAQGLSQEQIDRLLAPPPGRRGMPTTGTVKVLAILIAFSDYAPVTSVESIAQKLFGPEDSQSSSFPYESLRAYYRRSSYYQLDIQGEVLGWYTTSYPRSSVTETSTGRQNLIKEVLNYYNQQGHDFSQYDNDNDGYIDYFLVFWTGPHGEWASFWWGYYTSFSDSNYLIDGKRLRRYSWQWELYNYPSGEFSPKTAIHETGHALGLPDYYDYDDSVGPKGGVGNFDMMDSSNYDHNCFSKFVLDWITPAVFSSGYQNFSLRASGTFPEAVLFFPGAVSGDIFKEYFMVQNRYAVANDARLSSLNGGEVGLAVWHVDARLNSAGTSFEYDNSYTAHKLLMLVQADGLDEIENGVRGFNAGDFYRPGKEFGPNTYPNTNRYDGMPTEMSLTNIQGTGFLINLSLAAGANPGLRLSSSSLDFGRLNICTSSQQNITIYNDGQGVLVVESISRNSGASDFSYLNPALPFSIEAGGSKDITLVFSAYHTGNLSASFNISSNDPVHPQTVLSVNGSGFIPEINLNLQVERKVERAWILRRGFAVITVQLTKSAPFEVSAYRLLKKESGSSSNPQLIRTFADSDFQSGQLVYVDKYLELNKSYIYTMEAVDCYGRVIVSSSQEKQKLDSIKDRSIREIIR